MSSVLYAIRTNHLDKTASLLAHRFLKYSRGDVVFICDESKGEVDVWPFKKAVLTGPLIRSWGLTSPYWNWGWKCGDFCLYALYDAFPQYEHIFMIESDMYVTKEAIHTLTQQFMENPTDISAVQIRQDEQHRYSMGLSTLGLEPNWRCLFGIVGVSRRAIAEMRRLRLISDQHVREFRLNDEAILMGVAQQPEFSWVSLDVAAPALFEHELFHLEKVVPLEYLYQNDIGARICHSVQPLETIYRGISEGNSKYRRWRLRTALGLMPADMKTQIRRAYANKRKETKKVVADSA